MCSRLPEPQLFELLGQLGRPAADAFLEEAGRRQWQVEKRVRGVVRIHRLNLLDGR